MARITPLGRQESDCRVVTTWLTRQEGAEISHRVQEEPRLRHRRLLVGVSGSIAAYKAAELVRLFQKEGASVQVAMTASAQRFVAPLTFEALTHRPVVADLWAMPGQEIAHVERAHEVDAVILAPATANLIARVAAGLADDPVAAIVLSTRAPIILAPAMESGMWLNPVTQENVARMSARGATLVAPDEGELASGREGVGRLAELPRIVDAVVRRFAQQASWSGRRVLITAGPTLERIDPVRVLSNRSTGAMGIAIARAAAMRGAQVTLVLGPTHLAPPAGVQVVRVESARDMLAAGERMIDQTDVLIATAAVSDFRPAAPAESKLKRGDARAFVLDLVENPDVLMTLGARMKARDPSTLVVGFAAETEDVEAHARQKLAKKGCDLVIGNRVGLEVGFGQGETQVIAVKRQGPSEVLGPAVKPQVAEFVLDQAEQCLGQTRR